MGSWGVVEAEGDVCGGFSEGALSSATGGREEWMGVEKERWDVCGGGWVRL